MPERSGMTTIDPQFVPTPSGYELPLLHHPAHGAQAGPAAEVLLLPALGMQARFYRPLAEHLAAAGFATTRFEQRGHGHSALRPSRRSDWGFREWLQEDIPIAVDWIRHRSEAPLLIFGHSLGGHLGAAWSGLHPGQIDGLVIAATAAPWPPDFDGITAWQIRLLRVLLPVLGTTLGYYPGNRIGFGGREARTLMADWRRMATHNQYRARGLDLDLDAALPNYQGPLLQLAMADDSFAPPRAADAVGDRLPNASRTRVVLDAEALGCPADHFRWARHPERIVQEVTGWWSAASRPG